MARALVVTVVLFSLKRDSVLIWRGDTPFVFGGERRMLLGLWSHLSYTRLRSASLCNAIVFAGKEMVLSSAEALLCSREAGEKEKESARGTMGRGKTAPAFSLFPLSPARFYFSIVAIFIGKPSGSLCGGENRWIKYYPGVNLNDKINCFM